jgi:hypothetical protein
MEFRPSTRADCPFGSPASRRLGPRSDWEWVRFLGALHTPRLWRADDDLLWIRERARHVLDVDADGPAVRAEPEHEAN